MTTAPSNPTILIIDDNTANLGVLTGYLRGQGFQMMIARNGIDGIEKARFGQPDLILLDVMMPEIDGFETCRRLKADAKTNEIPVIFITALDSVEDKVNGFAAGGVDYLTKPLHEAEVLARVRTHLNIRALQQLMKQNQQLQQEIHERERAEAALRENELRFQKIFERHSAVMYLFDPDTERILHANRATAQFYGYSLTELQEMPISQINQLAPEDLQHAVQLAKMEYQNIFEFRHRLADGQIREVELHSTPITLEGQTVLFSIAHDITERKQIEAALRESERRLTDIIDFLPDATFVIDADGRVIAWNKEIELMTGISAEQMLGKGDYEYALPLYGERRPILIDLVTLPQAEIAEKYHLLEYRDGVLLGETYTPNMRGGKIYLSGKAAALYDSRGQRVGAIESIRDITERKQSEEALRAAHQELHEKNAHLRELNASKDKFFSIIAHDLRSPFTALLGYIELIEKQFDALSADGLKDYLTKLHLSARRLYALLENLLTWSRIQRGLVEFTPEALALAEIADDIVALFTSNAEQKSITLTNAIPKSVIVSADHAMVNTILRNLVSNALKFTRFGGCVMLSARLDARSVEVAVADTGCGMTPDVLAKLFRIDNQHTTTGTAGETGTGVGLILCHDLARKNGGALWVESAVGIGTTFRFTLPLACSVAIDAASANEDAVRLLSAAPIAAPILPPPDLLRVLTDTAKIGDIMELRRQLCQLAQDDVSFAPFVGRLQELAQQFDIGQILTILQHALAQERSSSLDAVTPERLAALPDGLMGCLKDAAVIADIATIEKIVTEIRPIDAGLAERIAELAGEFEYQKILELVSGRDALRA